jgi:hypothetical protein
MVERLIGLAAQVASISPTSHAMEPGFATREAWYPGLPTS